MSLLVQQIVNGLALGGVYSLIAIGWTTVFGIVGMINWTHGDVFMIGAFVGYIVTSSFGLPFLLALPIAMIASGVVAVLVDHLAYRPLRGAERLAIFITALGASTFLRNLAMVIWLPHARAYPNVLALRKISLVRISGEWVTVNSLQLLIFACAVVIMLALQFFIQKTRMGKAMLAASQDMEAVSLMGVEVDQVVRITFAVSGMLGGAAGVLVGVLYAIDPMMGAMAGLKGWAVAVLGGVGSITGAALAGIFLGVAENLAAAFGASGWRDAIAFLLMILTLLLKPTGLMGYKFEEKV